MVYEVAANSQSDIGTAGADAFRRDGLLAIRGLLDAAELAALQGETKTLITQAEAGNLTDCRSKPHKQTGTEVPFRVDYVVAKSLACQRLMGHPFVRASMQRLLGDDIFPTWDSMVFKKNGEGAEIPWHRDQGRGMIAEKDPLAINVAFYLDPSDDTNCLRGVPGSHLWADADAQSFIDGLGSDPFADHVAAKLPMAPGDVLLHNVFVLHGSPECMSNLRRVLYYEFRSRSGEARYGPHDDAYADLKNGVYAYCQFLRSGGAAHAPLLRIDHADHWRPDSAFVAGQLTA
jgi:ectoine hydroxylase-related dioxygenase (phytanoyl-CoA dioxygenase family)